MPPHAYFVVSAIFHYLGPAFAVLLFARVDVLGVAWLRIASAALIFAAWRRPWRAYAALDRGGRRLVLAWGGVLAVMNACFYLAIDRLPLGTVAAIEFLPVVALAALGARTPRNAAALALAVPGVYVLTGVRVSAEPLGLALAFANAVLFALYIVLADRVAKHRALSGIDGLAASMLVAAVVVTAFGGWAAAPALGDPVALLAGVGVGVSSSVIPYVADQLALRQLARATYALMVSLLPATATVIGVVVLAQVPSVEEAAGVSLVVAGVALHRGPHRAEDHAAAAAARARSGPTMDARALRWLLGFAVLSTAIHFTHNFVEIEDYPQSDLVSEGVIKTAIVVSWPIYTAIAVYAYRLYANGAARAARTWLVVYGLWAMVSLGHFVDGNPDIPLVWYATIWTDILAGALVLAFAVLSRRGAPQPARG